jgi:phosphopantetheinyl transferase
LVDRPGVEETALDHTERALLDELTESHPDDRTLWLLRFWTAKEAAGKAEGTGLAGRPRDLLVRQVSGERLLVEVHDRNGVSVRARWISTRVCAFNGSAINGEIANTAPHVVAWNGGDRPDDT